MPLFDLNEDASTVPLVVVDANICIDIHCEERDQHEASSGLRADWLADQLRLAVTEEIYNDFDRQEITLRNKMKAAIGSDWDVVCPTPSDVDLLLTKIRSIMGPPECPSDASDQRHLAIAVAAKASSFVTRDGGLLDNGPEIFAELGMRVQQPSEVIQEIDSVLRAEQYQFRELQNTGIEKRRLVGVKEIQLDQFVRYSQGEKETQLAAFLNQALALPMQYEVYHLRDSRSSLALLVIENRNDQIRSIIRIQIARKLDGTTLKNILAELIASRPVGTQLGLKPILIEIDDTAIDSDLTAAFLRRGFAIHNRTIQRVALPGIWTRESLNACLSDFAENNLVDSKIVLHLQDLISRCEKDNRPEDASELEQMIHPGKIAFGGLPTYVIPIKPRWAQELFDYRLWKYNLLEIDTKLVLNPDSVYYKLPKNSPKGDFCRILWYVSGDRKKGGNRITACSAMTKGVQGLVKDLFRTYRRLGVYEWKHLMDHFGAPDANAFLCEFTNTELFEKPVDLDLVQEILVRNGMKKQGFTSATRIVPQAFQEIYRHGFQRT